MSKTIAFIGCGQVASRAARLVQNETTSVLGVRRNVRDLSDDIPYVAANVQQPESMAFLAESNAETIVYSLAASEFSEQGYREAYVDGLRNTIAACNMDRVKRLVFVSSTSVYHQNDGSMVDESSPTNPPRFNGKIMLEAEQLALSTSVGLVLRLSGIYGPGRTRLIDRVRNGLCTGKDTDAFTNRIHVDDCAGVLAHILMQDTLPEIIIGTDSEPALSSEVESYIASELGVKKRYAQANDKKPKRIAGSKRCSNAVMRGIGYQLKHADYRSGYRELISDIKSSSPVK